MGRSKRAYDLLLNLWPVYKLGLWMGRQRAVGSVISPAFSARIHQVTMLPVNEPIAQGEQTVLPYTLLEELTERASSRFIMNQCVCRQKEHCATHPIELGCLFLGQGAKQIHPSLGRLCDAEEAKQHIQRGMQSGLFPLIAHTVLDAFTLGIPYKRMLTLCFCCECCCLVQRGLHKGPHSLLKAIQPLPGLRVAVDEFCSACGDCVVRCPVQAIILEDHHAQINAGCLGCGICLDACPNGAIKMHLDEKTDLLAEFIQRIQGYADITS